MRYISQRTQSAVDSGESAASERGLDVWAGIGESTLGSDLHVSGGALRRGGGSVSLIEISSEQEGQKRQRVVHSDGWMERVQLRWRHGFEMDGMMARLERRPLGPSRSQPAGAEHRVSGGCVL